MNISLRYMAFLSDKRTATLSVMITALIGAVLASIDNRLSTGMTNLMSLQFTFSADLFRTLISPLPENSINLFVRYLRLDIFFAFCYALSLSSISAAMWGHLNELLNKKSKFPSKISATVFRLGMILPYLAAIANIAENVTLYAVIRFDHITDTSIILQSGFAVSKYILLSFSAGTVVYLLLSRRRIMHGKD